MATFEETRAQTEQKVMVHLLGEIEQNANFTQRGVAQELGIALGLMNQYLKRCIAKGWVRASKVSPRRISYFLTPEGFTQKSKMVTNYLAKSLVFFREAREQCEELLQHCKNNGWSRVALVGEGDLASIVKLVGKDSGIEFVLVDEIADLGLYYDAVLITDIIKPQGTYDLVKSTIRQDRILTLKILHISRGI